MALPVYDSELHHFGLGLKGGTLNGYMISGGYRRDPQRMNAPAEFGGEDDQLLTALSRWTMDDITGGAYQQNFKTDTARFANSQNFLPQIIEKTARTVPPLVPLPNLGSLTLVSDVDDNKLMPTNLNTVAFVDEFNDDVRYIDMDTGLETDEYADFTAATIHCAAHDLAENTVFLIVKRTSDGMFRLAYIGDDHTTINYVGNFGTSPTPGSPARGMCVTAGGDIIASMKSTLWLIDMADDLGSATFDRVDRLPGVWKDALTYNGLTYILLTDTQQRTLLVAWDGTQVLPVVEFPYNFTGQTLCSYGGRIYVGGRGRDITSNDKYAELYEITAGSLRLVYTYSSEARADQVVPKNLYSSVVHEGILFFGTDRSSLLAYDLTRDAIWPNITIWNPYGHRLQVKQLTSAREKLFALCNDVDAVAFGDDADGFYWMATETDELTGWSHNDSGDHPDDQVESVSYIETSDFMPEIDRDKRWARLRLLTRYDPQPTVEYSIDSGDSWTDLVADASSNLSQKLMHTDFDLSDVPVSNAIRFRFSFDKTTVRYTEMIAFTTSFLLLDTGKQVWNFMVHGTENPELKDDTYPDVDPADVRATLRGHLDEKETLTYVDVDGSEHTVYISGYSESQPTVAPGAEAFYSLTLTEL